MAKNNMEQFITQMQEITGSIASKVDTIGTRVDNMAKYMVSTNKDIVARIELLEQHVVQYQQKCAPPKNVNTIQYNDAANNVEAIGTCTYNGKQVQFFGVCSKCGSPILSPSVIGYCKVNKLDYVCYPCQKGGKNKGKYTNIVFFNGSPQTQVQQQAVDTSVIVKCDICGKPRRYKSAKDYLDKKTYAESLGLHGTMCTDCAKNALSTLNNQVDQEQELYADPIAFERECNNDRRKMVLSIEDFITLVPGVDISELKIKDVRDIAEAHDTVIGFNGNEWNKAKKEYAALSTETEDCDVDEAQEDVAEEIHANQGF